MLQVVACITQQHDIRLVILAGLVCVLASLAAMNMLTRAQVSASHLRAFWTSAAGMVAGCGIWSTHFIAMLAFQPGLPVGYDMFPTLLSVVIAMSLSALGYAVALHRGMVLAGGAIAGAAIGTMHYVGMTALRAPAIAVWDINYVVVSWLIGISLTVLAVRIALSQSSFRNIALASILFTLAICGLHFTAMTAVTYYPDPTVAVPQSVFDPAALAIAVASAAILIIVLGLAGALVDNHLVRRARAESERLRAHVEKLETAQAKLTETSANLSSALVAADAANKAKSEFLSTMSHELRTPLNAVIGFSDMMLGETFGPLGSPRYREYLNDIHSSGKILLALINDVLDITRLDAGIVNLSDDIIDIGEIASEMARVMATQAASARIELTVDVDPALPRIRADVLRVRQVLLNLLGNAIKFTPEGGSVRVTAEMRGEEFAVIVADTGIGIAPEHLPKVTERFYQIDSKLARKYQGVGLGLPLVKQLMELHGGRLELESGLGDGTTMTVVFPAESIAPENEITTQVA